MFKLSVASPKNPARTKIRKAQILDSFSLERRKIEIKIKRNAIIFWING